MMAAPIQRDVILIDTRTPRQKALDLVESVAIAHKVRAQDIMGRCKTRDVAWARFEAMREIHEHLGWSSVHIGRFFGRDHTTALHALGKLRRAPGDVRAMLRQQEQEAAA